MPGICGGIVRKFSNSKNESKEDFCIENDNLEMMAELSEEDMDSSEEDENWKEIDDEEQNTAGQKGTQVSRRKKLKERLEQRKSNEMRTIFVGNAPPTSTRRDINKIFRAFGKIEAVYQRTLLQMTEKLTKLMEGKDKTLKDRLKSTNFFVRFSAQDEAENAACKMNGTQLGGNTIRVTTSNRRKFEHSLSIFLGNLPYSATDDQIHAHFAHCGSIFAVRVLRNKNNGMGTGVAYIQFEQRESCIKALEMNGQQLDGRPLRVAKVAKKKKLLDKTNIRNSSSNNATKGQRETAKAPKGTERFVVLKRKKRPAEKGTERKRKRIGKKWKKGETKGGAKRKSLIS
ncbi:hypothetical protein niasHT_022657 [Heterodera trifolii]|uniref:RRM domain-containing protein n=1 Tax=Heterodera trifolii TaxID=157864 RepID=A0ABD2JRE2_9BILA